MYKFYNAHPDGKRVDDCVKRAISVAEGRPYREVALDLNRLKKVTGCAKFNDNRNVDTYLENKRYILNTYPAKAGKPRMNGERFCESHPHGTYILRMAKHLTVCKEGVIYDTWDCTEKCVYKSYKVC